jgi:hypothetical protein
VAAHDTAATLMKLVFAWPSCIGRSDARTASLVAMGVVFQISGNQSAATSFVRPKFGVSNGKIRMSTNVLATSQQVFVQ